MTKLVWRPMAMADRDAIMDYIAEDNPAAAVELDDEFEKKGRARPAAPDPVPAGADARHP